MNILPANKPLSFEVTYDGPGLNVALTIYDLSGVSPVIVSGPSAMLNVVANTYVGSYVAAPIKKYLAFKAVYTDGTFTTLDTGYAQATETFTTNVSGSEDVLPDIEGVVDDVTDDIQGELDDVTTEIDGTLDC